MIRKIKDTDITNVMTIWVKGNFFANNFIEKDYWLEIYNSKKEDFLHNYQTFVYTENNEILGFISTYQEKIKAIFVKQDYRRKGIGKKLINYCKNNNKVMEVQLYEKNINAVLFFNSMDFKNTKVQLDNKFAEKEYIMLWKNDEF